jgi:hypothetical protein
MRRQLEREFGGPFEEPFWRRVYKNVVRDHIEDPEETSWNEVRGVAEDLFTFQQEVVAELEPPEEQGSVAGGSVIGAAAHKREPRRDSRFEPEDVKTPTLTLEESLRAEVFEEYLATVAAHDYYVARFRRRELRGRSLDAEQAYRVIRSAAAQAFPHYWFDEQRIPIEAHDAELVDYERRVRQGSFTFDYATITVRWPNNPFGITTRQRSHFDGDRRFRELTFQNEKGAAESIHVWRGSVLGELQEVASQLARRFPWQEAQATWYVLTGVPPAVPPVRVRVQREPVTLINEVLEPVHLVHHGLIFLSTAPWVSRKTSHAVQVNIQQRILRRRESHQLDEKTLELLRFVIQRENPLTLDRGRRRKVGKVLQEAWDKEKPHWAYGERKQATSEFWRDYGRAERLVAPALGVDIRTLWRNGSSDDSS